MLNNHIKVAWRHLRKDKLTSLINIGGLAVGMAVALMIGLWVQDELTFNQDFEHYDRLAQVYRNGQFNGEIKTSDRMAVPLANVLKEEYGADFERVALTTQVNNSFKTEKKELLRRGLFVQPDFVDMFSIDFLSGGNADELENRNHIFISQQLSETLFDKTNPIGETVVFGGEGIMEEKGVFKNIPNNSSFEEIEFLAGWSYALEQFNIKRFTDSWGEHSFRTYVQVAENSQLSQVSDKIKNIEQKYAPSESVNPELFLFPMSKWHLYSEFKNGKSVGGAIQFVWLFSIIGIFVLLLACINFINLSTARSEKRAKEVGVRKTIGSGKRQLILQYLSESLLTAGIGIALAIALVALSLSWFNQLTDKQLHLPFSEPAFILGLLGSTVLIGLLAGSYPAFYLSSFQPLQVLKGSFKMGRWSSLPRQVLVTLQFTVSVALITGTIIIYQQINYAKNRDHGYAQEQLIQFFAMPDLNGKQDVLEREMMNTGFVEEMSYASSEITNYWSNQSGFNWEGKEPTFSENFGVISCAHDFGETVAWNIIAGRDFSDQFAMDSAGIILSQSAADIIGMEEVVGQTVIRWGEPYQVLGIVEDLIVESPWTAPKSTIFFNDIKDPNVFFLKMKEGIDMQQAIASLESVYKQLSPSMPFVYEFVDENYRAKFQAEERIGKLSKVFALLAVLISCLGIFGLSVFVAERRNKEISIRKVLGASITSLWSLQSKEFIKLVLIACLIAIPISWYILENWLSQYDYRISIQWVVFLLASSLAIAVTLLTVSVQSVKAALANPVKSLRSE